MIIGNFPTRSRMRSPKPFEMSSGLWPAPGPGWEHVIAVNSYHLGFPEEVNQLMSEWFRHYMPNHAPIWTALGVAALGDPKMRVEIRVSAILPEPRE
jgi:enamine deaminase RidA (YjgF/YER057c/UK114 family)